LGKPAVLGLARMPDSKTKPNNRKEETTSETKKKQEPKEKKNPKEEEDERNNMEKFKCMMSFEDREISSERTIYGQNMLRIQTCISIKLQRNLTTIIQRWHHNECSHDIMEDSSQQQYAVITLQELLKKCQTITFITNSSDKLLRQPTEDTDLCNNAFAKLLSNS
jgi:membrane peptidoglycan carboxypeptidase